MLELKKVSAGYGGSEILHDVSLDFQSGCVLGILGPNGSGKSTLLRTAAGLHEDYRGEVLLDGSAMRRLPPKKVAQKVSYLPQFRNVPDISVARFVLHGRFPWIGYPRRYSAEDRRLARQALERVGASELAGLSLKELSGGQRQRAYLAMVLAQNARTLLFDEPTTYLDIAHQLRLTSIARELAGEGRAVVLVLHDLPLAFSCCDRLALLQDGSLTAQGTPDEVFRSGLIPRIFSVALRRTEEPCPRYYYDFRREI